MIKFLSFFLIILFSHCSFDKKSGIWTNSNDKNQKKVENRFKDFETLFIKEKTFNKIIRPSQKISIKLGPIKNSKKWNDEFYDNSNNLKNFNFKNLNNLISKGKKLSNHHVKD